MSYFDFKTIFNTFLHWLMNILIITLILGILSYFILFCSPYTTFKDYWVTTALNTYSKKYLGTFLVSKEYITKLKKENTVTSIERTSNPNLVEVKTKPKYDQDMFGNINQPNAQIYSFSETDMNQTSKVVNEQKGIIVKEISGSNYKGKLMIIDDPSRVFLGTSEYLGEKGESVGSIIKKYGGIGGTNAGGFDDPKWRGTGGTPMGIVISQGRFIVVNKEGRVESTDINSSDIYLSKNPKTLYDLIGIDTNNKLVVGKYTLQEIKNMNIREAVSFIPVLVINGKGSEIQGNGGFGIQPRTAIGQRKDGAILLLTIDGRQPGHSIGVSIKKLRDILLEEGAINAANLDGGSSASMVFNEKIITKPCDKSKKGRPVPNAFVVMP